MHQRPRSDRGIAPSLAWNLRCERAIQTFEDARGGLAQSRVSRDPQMAAKHQTKALRILQSETHIGFAPRPQPAGRPRLLQCAAELREALGSQRRQQALAIRKMTVRRAVRHAGAARRFPQTQTRNPMFFQHLPGSSQQGCLQTPMVIDPPLAR